ncbi:MAG: mevalonate kinase [Corynebacterium sp.]|uniref:mevalonate kinase n=1 Tax=Corynebacterium sp. TaxID=1720 RepID=UPI0026DB136A|nr:mevalonate kinase [Corynebacterium sp.]MDO5030083.1 mevalonate kinase [Corynebacterium sp.]
MTSVDNASVDGYGIDKDPDLETGEYYSLTGDKGTAFGEAHAKSILIGEHSVVFGKPAIALPVTSLRTMATIDVVEDSPVLFSMDGEVISIDELPERFASIAAALRAGLRTFDLPERNMLVRLRSGIPPAAGLGGSAAVAHALVEAVRDFADGTLTEKQRFDLVQEAERLAHGNPSGMDAIATRATRPVYFKQGDFRPLEVGKKMWLVIGDTGVRGSTSLAVARVRGFVDSHRVRGQELLDNLEQLTDSAVRNLARGDVTRLGHRMDAAQEALEELGVGHESITDLVTAARLAGAEGAKLTGAGCGGCVMALADSADQADLVSHAMMGANAVATWTVEVNPS